MDFDQINQARTRARSIEPARETDRAKLLASMPNLRLCSAVEYHGAIGSRNAAAVEIDAGREPYLISLYSLKFDQHPFVPVHDVWTHLQDDKTTELGVSITAPHVVLELNAGPCIVSRDTLIAWR